MYRIGEIIENDGVKYKVIDILDKNGQIFYDLRELDGDGELNDVPEFSLHKVRYTIHKCCKLKSNPNRIFDLECPDYCGNEKEASVSFKYAFRHHIGVYPTKEQRERFLSFDNIFVENGDVTYIFFMTISD